MPRVTMPCVKHRKQQRRIDRVVPGAYEEERAQYQRCCQYFPDPDFFLSHDRKQQEKEKHLEWNGHGVRGELAEKEAGIWELVYRSRDNPGRRPDRERCQLFLQGTWARAAFERIMKVHGFCEIGRASCRERV